VTGRSPAVSIGVFGGTFDPPHVGHLIAAQDAALALGLDRILFVPAASPPHKQDAALTEARVRARMLALAIEGDERFGIDTLELERPGESYTVDTLRELVDRQPGVRWTLLMGADQYEEFATWRGPVEIRKMARIAVLARSGGYGAPSRLRATERSAISEAQTGRQASLELTDGDVAVEVTRIDVSATTVRRRVAAGLPIRYLVPPAVEEFIFEQHLYVRNGTPVAG
jgi:nicotinate-nucleotide adenylyltransferase